MDENVRLLDIVDVNAEVLVLVGVKAPRRVQRVLDNRQHMRDVVLLKQ
jgi:hypothetical protein